jgi:hypothetical protein
MKSKTGKAIYMKNIRKCSTPVGRSFCWITVGLTLFGAHVCLGDDSGVQLKTGGIQIVLPQGWELLNQPTNIFTQQRARNSETGFAVSAGAFKIGLTLEQYVSIGIAAFESSPEQRFEKVSKISGIPTSEIEKAVQSQIGHQMLAQMERAYKTMHFELLSVNKINISGMTVYETRAKQILQQSGQVVYSRQFTLKGASPNEIINISFGGRSEDIFQDKSLVDSIQK